MRLSWGIPCRGRRFRHEDQRLELNRVPAAASQESRPVSASSGERSTNSSLSSFDHRVLPQSPLERLMDSGTDAGYFSTSSPSQTGSSDSGSQTSSSSLSTTDSSARRKRPGRKWSFRRAVTPGEVEDLKADEERVRAASPLDRVARRRATVKQLIETESEISGNAVECQRAEAASLNLPRRFPIVSSRHWFHIELENRDLQGGIATRSQLPNECRLGEQEVCASATSRRSHLTSCIAETRRWEANSSRRPHSAPLRRTAAVSFDDSALQIHCVTPDTDTSSSSESYTENGDWEIATQPCANYSRSSRERGPRPGCPAHGENPVRFHCGPGSIDEATVRWQQKTDRRAARQLLHPPSSCSFQGFASKCQRGTIAPTTQLVSRQSALDFNTDNRPMAIVYGPRSLPGHNPMPEAKRQDGNISPNAQARRRVFSASGSAHSNTTCPALTTLLTSNQENQPRPLHKRQANCHNPLPAMNVKLIVIEPFHASKLSQISASPGEQLWTEQCCFSKHNGGWVWCYSPSYNKMGFLPTRCVKKCAGQILTVH